MVKAGTFKEMRVTSSYRDRVTDILTNAERYHWAYYEAGTFRGPSLYFHQRALQPPEAGSLPTHLEYVYATLASWGMHRMGQGGPKMQAFDTFRRSVESLKDRIAEARQFSLQHMRAPEASEWKVLYEVFRGVNVMATGPKLVGNSKVMHHIMPNIVPPIDGEYTLCYLLGNKTIKPDVDWQWRVMKGIILDFFIPVACNAEFGHKATNWMMHQDQYPWDTTRLKVIDNLIIGSKKAAPPVSKAWLIATKACRGSGSHTEVP